MSLLSLFNDFYGNLSSNGLFFFWIVVFLFVFLIFLLIVLYFKNKRLVKLIMSNRDSITSRDNVIDNNGVSMNNDVIIKEDKGLEGDTTSLTGVKEVVKDENKNDIQMVNEIKPLACETKVIKDNTLEVGPYKKNVLREMNTRGQTSPISIVRDDNASDTSFSDNIDDKGIDLFEDSVSPFNDMEDVYDVNDNMRFASDVVSRMEKDVKSSNIELTEYEKKQEEEAIISYGELLKVKDKIYNITEDEENDEFIDELKNFRLDLE